MLGELQGALAVRGARPKSAGRQCLVHHNMLSSILLEGILGVAAVGFGKEEK
jgi:hypothetical protein